ncbi:MAG TPA: ubiquinone biosynthesis regulatory protein kinase UbiB [Gammaproteobacteria bacterium]|nr:ubiquinone biosynthesis regulatory protein kinase UbiB [Gammaproteobacteria bacterium]
MITLRQGLRLWRVNWVLMRHGLVEIVLATHIYRPLRFVFYLNPFYWTRDRGVSRGERIRLSLVELGPIFVKFGQVLSTRRDLLPPDISEELAKLQDQVPPFPGALARAMVETSLGQPVTELFSEFNERPLASASIAQVHAARLKDGREVVVKVLRPGVEQRIRADLDVLYLVAGLADAYWSDGKRLRPLEVVAEYEKTVLDELDLVREAANAAQLKRNFQSSELLYVPEVHWDLTRRDVMVMERIRGVPISDIATLRARGTDMKRLAENGVQIFFTQVFKHNFFHADMHPGNIFVGIDDPQHPLYMAVDFGIIGTLSVRDQHYLAENFLAFFKRDYQRVAELHVESGWVPAGTRADEFEMAIRTVCEPIFNKPLKDISFAQVLLRLFQTARRFNMEVQPQLVLLQKTLFNIEGLGRDLYPDLDLWQTAKPFLEDWTRERYSPKATLKRLKAGLPVVRELLLESPGRINAILRRLMEEDPARRGVAEDVLRETIMGRTIRHRYRAAAGGALLLGGLVLFSVYEPGWWGLVLAAVGALLLVWGYLTA